MNLSKVIVLGTVATAEQIRIAEEKRKRNCDGYFEQYDDNDEYDEELLTCACETCMDEFSDRLDAKMEKSMRKSNPDAFRGIFSGVYA